MDANTINEIFDFLEIDESKTVKGYEINITKYFYKYKPLRPLADIRADILALEQETEGMDQEVLEG